MEPHDAAHYLSRMTGDAPVDLPADLSREFLVTLLELCGRLRERKKRYANPDWADTANQIHSLCREAVGQEGHSPIQTWEHRADDPNIDQKDPKYDYEFFGPRPEFECGYRLFNPGFPGSARITTLVKTQAKRDGTRSVSFPGPSLPDWDRRNRRTIVEYMTRWEQYLRLRIQRAPARPAQPAEDTKRRESEDRWLDENAPPPWALNPVSVRIYDCPTTLRDKWRRGTWPKQLPEPVPDPDDKTKRTPKLVFLEADRDRLIDALVVLRDGKTD